MSQKTKVILGIESSCDDTSAAILKNETVLANVISSQKIHEEYGGVVPELASRAHQQNIVPVIDAALKEANIALEDIDGIAFTRGPGLMGSLIVGVSFAKALSLAKNIPILDVNHMHGHVLSLFIDEANVCSDEKPSFPFLCLIVSGGHTQLVQVNSGLDLVQIGTTLDDAAGEAFDKIGKILGLPYPAGPHIDRLAKEGKQDAFLFSKPQIKNLDFSFSGLKTSVLYFLNKQKAVNPAFVEENLADLCASVQATIVSILLKKIVLAASQTGFTQIALAGGVAANSGLRQGLISLCEEKKWKPFIPKLTYCTDNAAMIAMAGKFLLEAGVYADQSITANPRMPFQR